MGAAGPVYGLRSSTPAARFVDLTGGLDSRRHLSHPRYPFALTGNVMYRRELLKAVEGFDTRYATYDACDLHTRLSRRFPGYSFQFLPRAVVFHRHRSTWAGYFRQQIGYGRGYAQFMLDYDGELTWSVARELREWASVLARAPGALLPGRGEQGVLARGAFLRGLGQRIGFATTFWCRAERARW